MSADYWLEDLQGCDPEHPGHHYNVTYNLREMLRAAGLPEWRALDGAPAVEAAGMLAKVAETLPADPARFKALDPPNGWGDYDGALRFVESFALGCALHPEARIGAWL